mmetsp:Transcript_36195/g.44154  ORF Transcript_36195/g.44154 Transcript_36195/m.44154 type:complete len:155 (-) Transcript_36195:754-1218(-)
MTQSLQLLYHLVVKRQFDYILVQNPPCIPLLMVTALVRVLSWPLASSCSRDQRWKRNKGTQVVIDWHNYGWTILEVNRVNRFLVKAARQYELFFGRFGDYHLAVSEAMAKNLAEIAPAIGRKPIHVLYDRATPKFTKASLATEKKLFDKINLKG